MKYVIVIPDGCADEPQATLNGRTPLEAARTPMMDRLAQIGIVGWANHTPLHLPAGSDVANMSLLGYSPDRHYSGRAPIEAVAQGIELQSHDWVVRCNLVTIQDQIMRDFTAGHISTGEATELMNHAQQQIQLQVDPDHPCDFAFYPGVSYRNLLLCRPRSAETNLFSRDTRTTPPHDLMDQRVAEDFPRGPGSQILSELMGRSREWFADHPVNRQRIDTQQLPATHIWLWGLGQLPQLDSFHERFKLRGAMITGVDLLRGLASLIGWQRIDVPGATGYLDTDYAAKAAAAIAALEQVDLVCIHVEAPDEASHQGSIDHKIEALERIDREIVGPVSEKLRRFSEWRILISPDHPTLVRTKTHSHGNVPFIVAGTGVSPAGAPGYGESIAEVSDFTFPEGHRLMDSFIHSEQL